MAHYLKTGKFNATHFEYALVGGLSISQALLVSPLTTTVRKLIGAQPTLHLGAVLIFVALLTSSFATKVWHLFLSQGLCFGWGMGFSYVTAAALLPPWFTSRRSLAVGIATSGAGVGGLVYSLMVNQIIEELNVAWAYKIIAFSALTANVFASLLLQEWRGRNQAISDELHFAPRDFRRIEVLLIIFWGITTELGYIILLYSLPTFASSIGLTLSQGSIASALLNLGLAVGRPLVGHFSDSYGRINMAGLTTLLCAVSCFAIWIPAQSLPPLLLFSLVAGAFCGTFWSTLTPVLAEVVGIHKLASTQAVVLIALVLPTTFAEGIAMELVSEDSGNMFRRAQLLVAFMFLAGSLCLWFLRCWKIFQVRSEAERNTNHVSLTQSPLTKRSRYWVQWLTPQLLFSPQRA